MFTTKHYDDYKQAAKEIVEYLDNQYYQKMECDFILHSTRYEEVWEVYFFDEDDPKPALKKSLRCELKHLSNDVGTVYWDRHSIKQTTVDKFSFEKTLSAKELEQLAFEDEFFAPRKYENDGFDCHLAVGDKLKYLQNNCPVKLDYTVQNRKCTVCNSVFKLTDYKVLSCFPEDQIVCAKHPFCKGIVYDWITTTEEVSEGSRLPETRKEYDEEKESEEEWMKEEQDILKGLDSVKHKTAPLPIQVAEPKTESALDVFKKNGTYESKSFEIKQGGIVAIYKDNAEHKDLAIVVVNKSFYDYVQKECDKLKDTEAMEEFLFSTDIEPLVSIEIFDDIDSELEDDEE